MIELTDLSRNNLQLLIEAATSLTTLLLTIITVTLTIIILRHTAKPNLKATVDGNRRVAPGDDTLLTFHLNNIGHWYGSPPATSIDVFVNVEPDLEPKVLRYGSDLERETRNVRRGVGPSKYLHASGIILFYEEPGESLELVVGAPQKTGTYNIWLSARSSEGGHVSKKTKLRIVDPSEERGALHQFFSSIWSRQ